MSPLPHLIAYIAQLYCVSANLKKCACCVKHKLNINKKDYVRK